MTKDEVLKLALEALEEAADAIDSWGSYASGYFQVKHDLESDISKAKSVITAIKETLAQPEHGWTPERIKGMARLKEAQDKKLAQPDQEQLMSDQINYGMSVTQGGKRIDPMSIYKEPEQEPVAMKFKIYKPTVPDPTRQGINNALLPWVYDQDRASGFDATMWVTPVATLSPQRNPLTDEEIILIVAECAASHQHTDIHFARAIERAHGIKELV